MPHRAGHWRGSTYEELCRNHQWRIPERYNIGTDICDKWAGDKFRVALVYVDEDGRERKYTYWELKNLSNRLANALTAHGLAREDRVAVLMPPLPETLITHLAVYKAGGILVPLLHLFGPLAIEYRLRSSRAKMIFTDRANLPKILDCRAELPDLEQVIVVDSDGRDDCLDFWDVLTKGSRDFKSVATGPDDPAILIYTSGTTGPPKGALQAHRLMISEASNTSFSLDLFPKPGDLLWTHCDWAYIAGSFTALYPTMHFGHSILEYRRTGRFDPEQAFHYLSRYGVSAVFAIATAIRLMRQVVDSPRDKYDLGELRTITVGGETMGRDLFDWGRQALGVEFNENYGLTECDFTICNCSSIMDVRLGSMGRTIPGHTVEIIDAHGQILPPGEYGQIGIKNPDPSMFLGYWDDPEATAERFIGPWLKTGDFGTKDEDGYFWFVGREDDVIESGGYRIGPGEIEDALKKHPAVEMAAVIGVPDPIKGEAVKAFIVAAEGFEQSPALAKEIRNHVRNRLEAHAYPKEIEFMASLPVGNTDKVQKKELKRLDAANRAARAGNQTAEQTGEK